MRLKSIALAFVFAVCAVSQTLPQGVQKKATVGGITEYAFPNGLRVLSMADASSPKVTVNMTYLVGSRHEGYGETGMAHLLEHMLFILSTNNREIKKELVAHGASWNGSTSYDRTNYYETVTATDENLAWALGLEAERMVNMRMEKPILDTEMTVVRNEFERGENSTSRVLEERVVATAYLWHNYGKSTIGSREDIEKVPIDRLAAFYRKYYQPDNAVLIVTGRIDETKALAAVARTCGAIPRPQRKLEQPYTVEPVQDGQRYVELRRVGDGQEIMSMYHVPAAGHPDAAALQVLAGLMSGSAGGYRGSSSGAGLGRLSKALVDNKKAVSASMSFRPLHDPGFITASARLTSDQSLDEARKILLATVEGLVKKPPTREEVERVKTRLLGALENRMTDSQSVGLGLSEPVAQGDWRLWFLGFDRIKGVTPEDVARVSKAYFKESNRTIGVFLPTPQPDRAEVPSSPDLEKLFANYRGSETLAAGEAFDPTPANIESRMVRATLPSGLKLAILPRKTRGGTVSAVLELHFGDEKSLAGKHAAASMAGALLMRGTKHHTRQQLQDEMDRLNARIFVTGGASAPGSGSRRGRGGSSISSGIAGAAASIETKAGNLAPALALALEMLREPAFSEFDFDQVRTQRIAAIEETRSEPSALAAEALVRRINPYRRGDARYVGTAAEQIEDLKKVTLDDVRKFHSQFYGASHAELVVLGQCDPAEVRKTAAELLGHWASAVPYVRLASTYSKVEPANLKIETPDKQNATFEAGMRIQMSEKDPDYPAMLLANAMFGGSLGARMPNRIRNVEGLSYSVSSRFSASFESDAASFTASAISNPQNTPKVEASFKDELAKTLASGFTAEEVAGAKKAWHDLQMVGRSEDAALIRVIASRERFGRTMKWDEQLDVRIDALTADQINSAFRKHLAPAALIVVKAGDFQKAGVFR